jgi:nucleoside-diphosphate-sugar epimerase
MRVRDGRVVSNFIVQALRGHSLTIYGQGTQTRSFCYVTDTVEGLYRLFNSNRVDPTNIGNPTEYTVLQLSEIVLELTSSTSPIVFKPLPVDDPQVRQPDITVAQRELEWTPTVPIRDGLLNTIQYLREKLSP